MNPEPLWVRARRARLAKTNRAARARIALRDVLRRAGHDVSLVTIHGWSRRTQGRAYLWAIDFIEGRENVPPPFLEEMTG